MSDPALPTTTRASRSVLDLENRNAAIAALRRGDTRALLQELAVGLVDEEDALLRVDDLPPGVTTLLHRAASVAMELRRENVAVIGDHEAFVRHTPDGSLRQVLQPVRLSLHDGTLMQITGRRPFIAGTQDIAPKNYQGTVEWRDVIIGDPRKANVLVPGFIRMNAVAGCQVGQPPEVMVDGVARTNPYVDREVRTDGRTGSIRRIVVGIVVVGAAPSTGQPVAVNYVLDYSPVTDLLHMLAGLAEDKPSECELVQEAAFDASEAGWAYLPLAEGIGYRYRLASAEVRGIFRDYVQLQANAQKKALTVARRNAMKAHPAFEGMHSVEINPATGSATVRMVGWAGDAAAIQRMQKLAARVANGQALDEDFDIIEAADVYDPEKDVRVDGDEEAGIVRETTASPEIAQRNELIAYVDAALARLASRSTKAVARFDWRPSDLSLEQLQERRDEIDKLLDET